jgi:dTDP-4-dehydrorhamnose 3,5-epimerase
MDRNMQFKPSPNLPEVIVLEPEIFKDQRGFFTEMHHEEKFHKVGIKEHFVQDNRARSSYGVLRGLHYQIGKPQAKIVWVLSGGIFDVAVDIRTNSPTFGKWCGFVLSEKNKKGVYIPPDFAHGYAVLTKKAEVLYKCSDFYAPDCERSIRWDDPDLAIEWPIKDPVLSKKDAIAPFFKDAELPRRAVRLPAKGD